MDLNFLSITHRKEKMEHKPLPTTPKEGSLSTLSTDGVDKGRLKRFFFPTPQVIDEEIHWG